MGQRFQRLFAPGQRGKHVARQEIDTVFPLIFPARPPDDLNIFQTPLGFLGSGHDQIAAQLRRECIIRVRQLQIGQFVRPDQAADTGSIIYKEPLPRISGKPQWDQA